MEPQLLKGANIPSDDLGRFAWNLRHPDVLSITEDALSVQWDYPMVRYTAKYPPQWVQAPTHAVLHSGSFEWDFVVEEMASRQIGLGFMLMWDVGPDWGFFGYLGASQSAWAYDPSTGDVVVNTRSIQGGLPTFSDRRTGTVTVHADLPRAGVGSAHFIVNGTATNPLRLTESAVLTPAACLLAPTQRVRLANLRRLS